MYLVEQHIIRKGDARYKQIDHVCYLSKNLYNAALYTIKQEFLNSGKWIRYAALNKMMVASNNVDYRAMSGSSSQQVLMGLDNNLKSYFSSIKAWKRDNKKFTGCPKFPRYKDKTQGRNKFQYSYAQFKHRDGMLYFPKKEHFPPLKTNAPQDTVKQVRFIPNIGYYAIEVVYEFIPTEQLPDNGKVMAIDLGVNNLAACVINVNNEVILIDGRKLKFNNN